ncbi:MAG TPA: HYR domain-containing protein [Acidobacteriota bacterium]|nr:HYR domain-containing protein [Acidobacteriota bacterium]
MRRLTALIASVLALFSAQVSFGANAVVVESKSVAASAAGVTVGVHVENDVDMSGMVVPLELRAVTPGSYITTSFNFAVQGRVGSSGLTDFPTSLTYGAPDAAFPCSGPVSNSYATSSAVDYVSPDAALWVGVVIMNPFMAPGNDGLPGVGIPSFLFTFDVTGVDGLFEIDTCCVTPANHLQYVDGFYMPITPSFTKGVVTIGDTNHAPTAVCVPPTIGTPPDLCEGPSFDPAMIDGGSFDIDTGDVITLGVFPAGPYPIGISDIWLVVTDNHGAADTCQTVLTVVDREDPVANCPGPLVFSNSPGQCGAAPDFFVEGSDNCPGVTQTFTPASGTFFPVGTTQVMSVATDAAGNADTCYFDVTVNDDDDPVLSCGPDITVPNDPDECGAVVNYESSISVVDNCPGLVVTGTPTSGSFFLIGTTQVEVVATDGADNADTCFFNVIVEDDQAPVAICPGDIEIVVSPGTPDTVVTFTSSASDNCPGATVTCDPPSGSVFAVGATSVCCVAVDATGDADTCCFTVTVREESPVNRPPVALCQDITLSAGDDCTADGSVDDGSYDPDGDSITLDQDPAGPYSLGSTTVDLIVTDDKGAVDICQGVVTVVDDTPPVVECPTDIVVGNDPGVCGAIVSWDPATSIDNCSDVSASCVPPSGSFFPIGTTTVTCTAVDSAGNSGGCTFDVTVNDTDPPIANCPGDIDVIVSLGTPDTVVTFPSTVIDNCPGATVWCDPPSGSVFPVGATLVCCVAEDAAGDADTCCFTVTVREDTLINRDPVALCQDITLSAGDDCTADGSIDAGSYDPDGDPITLDQDPAGPYPLGSTTVDLIVTDDKGAVDICQAVVTVVDDTPPVVDCPADIVVGNDSATCGAIVEFIASASDNCGGGYVDIVWVVDGSGSMGDDQVSIANNAGLFFQGLAGVDFRLGVLAYTEQANPVSTGGIFKPGGPGTGEFTSDETTFATMVTAVGTSGSVTESGLTALNNALDWYPFRAGCRRVLVLVTDEDADDFGDFGLLVPPLLASGATIHTVISFADSTGYSTLAPSTGGAQLDITTDWGTNLATLAAQIFISATCDPPSGSLFPVGVTTVTCTAVDGAGNPDSCTFEVTVNDTELPIVQCPSDTTIPAPPGAPGVTVEFSATADDNCPGVMVECTPASGSFFPGGTTVVTCVATDAAGNADTCRFTVTVTGAVVARTVALDIKPNTLNVKPFDKGQGNVERGVLPVVILGGLDFDVNDIDLATILLEGVAPLPWASFGDIAAPSDDSVSSCKGRTGGPDGYEDLSLKFPRVDIVAALGPVTDGDVIVLTATGSLLDGTAFQGQDCVLIRADKGSAKVAVARPDVFDVGNYPNPFNATTTIRYTLTDDTHVQLHVFDVLGRRVARLVDEQQSAGSHAVPWDGRDDRGRSVATGVYFYRLMISDAALTKKMVLLK